MSVTTFEIKLNGRTTAIEAGSTLVDLVRRYEVSTDAAGMAIAVNEAVVPRPEWTSRRLEPGDVVEIIRAVQGG